jgi:hypothetical protein
MTLEAKILKALRAAVEDGNVYETAGGNAAFGLYGALAFIETLVGLCDEEEREVLVTDWIVNDVSSQFVNDLFSQMVARAPVNYMTDHMEILAEKLLSHYSTEVDQFISERNRVNPFEDDRHDFYINDKSEAA